MATQLTLSARKSDTDSEVVLMDDHGLVRVGSALVVLQPNGEPRQVTDIFVGGWDHNFLQDDKLIYFIGKNWRLGSQLYVYDLNSTAVESPVGIPSAPVRIYPNPVTDVLYIDIPDKNFSGDMRYEIYTSEGHRSGDGRAGGSINVSDLIPGFYFIYLREGEFESVLKFVKE